ncbi:MAG TPA: SAM-dependent methyltransferase [Firmicutes bacterium]|nr:SAM-dependent methyltransferase [Bacillota bacterium]
MSDYIANRISKFNRVRKFNFFMNELKPRTTDRILDVGATDIEYTYNDNILEKLYKLPVNITVLGVESYNEFREHYPEIKCVTYDGTIFPFKNKSFDICWCNAVLEHVGNFEKQLSFIKEIERSSQKAFITTPNRFFPIEVHTKIPLLHYLPRKVFNKILQFIGRDWAAGNYMFLLSLKDLIYLFEKAGIKKYKIYKNKILFFTMTYSIVIGEPVK